LGLEARGGAFLKEGALLERSVRYAGIKS